MLIAKKLTPFLHFPWPLILLHGVLDAVPISTLSARALRDCLFLGISLASEIAKALSSFRNAATSTLTFRAVRFALICLSEVRVRQRNSEEHVVPLDEEQEASGRIKYLLDAIVDHHVDFIKTGTNGLITMLKLYNELFDLPQGKFELLEAIHIEQLNSGLQLLIDGASRESLMDLFSKGCISEFKNLDKMITKAVLKTFFTRLEGNGHQRPFLESLVPTWNSLKGLLQTDHPHHETTCKVLSEAIGNVYANSQDRNKMNGFLSMLVEWPIAGLMIADLNSHQIYLQKLSKEAQNILTRCQSSGLGFLMRLEETPDFVRYVTSAT